MAPARLFRHPKTTDRLTRSSSMLTAPPTDVGLPLASQFPALVPPVGFGRRVAPGSLPVALAAMLAQSPEEDAWATTNGVSQVKFTKAAPNLPAVVADTPAKLHPHQLPTRPREHRLASVCTLCRSSVISARLCGQSGVGHRCLERTPCPRLPWRFDDEESECGPSLRQRCPHLRHDSKHHALP